MKPLIRRIEICHFLTVWFHRPDGGWLVLDDFHWHKDAAFDAVVTLRGCD